MMSKKRIGIILVLALAAVMVTSGIAYANFGPHGGYEKDTDACAGCHRAHTSFATVGWTDGSGVEHGSALLVSSASTQEEFCLACHGDLAPGASTNVESGIFDSGPSASETQTVFTSGNTDMDGVSAFMTYETASSFEATLNGGGFTRLPIDARSNMWAYTTSLHDIDETSYTDPMWGAGQSGDNPDDAGTNLQCGSCHDPHGSSNYRLLKDEVNGAVVGGYDTNDIPDPFVSSREVGYPWSGWLKHEAGMAQIDSYKPNYTSTAYGYMPASGGQQRSISGWCAGCHTQYIERASNYSYVVEDAATGGSTILTGAYYDSQTDSWSGSRPLGEYYDVNNDGTIQAGEHVGNRMRYRHAMNVAIDATHLNVDTVTDTLLPLENAYGSSTPIYQWTRQSIMGCLTCHRAHGTSATMTGWAESSYVSTTSKTVTWYPEIDPGSGGVNPNNTSALLRVNNRGVCERCHNK